MQVLFDLASDGLKTFLAQKFLRSNHVDADTVYHLYRIASHLGDPYYESRCRGRLTDVLRFRQLAVPVNCVPLAVPLLCPGKVFLRRTKQLLGQCLDISQDRLLPYHVPATKIVPTAHPKIKDLLFNHQRIVSTWDAQSSSEEAGWQCTYTEVLKAHPRFQTVDGHVASSATLLTLPPDLQCMAGSSSNNTVFPNMDEHWDVFWNALCKWTKHHNLLMLPRQDVYEVWLSMWQLHTVNVGDRWNFGHVKRLKALVPGVIWHVKDHESAHIHVFCPKKYWSMLDNTYGSAQIFFPVPINYSCAFAQIEQAVPPEVQQAFAYGFRFRHKSSKLPWSYILPKHKKNWKAGRPIVGFSAHPAKKFLTVLARVMDGLVGQAARMFELTTMPFRYGLLFTSSLQDCRVCLKKIGRYGCTSRILPDFL